MVNNLKHGSNKQTIPQIKLPIHSPHSSNQPREQAAVQKSRDNAFGGSDFM